MNVFIALLSIDSIFKMTTFLNIIFIFSVITRQRGGKYYQNNNISKLINQCFVKKFYSNKSLKTFKLLSSNNFTPLPEIKINLFYFCCLSLTKLYNLELNQFKSYTLQCQSSIVGPCKPTFLLWKYLQPLLTFNKVTRT